MTTPGRIAENRNPPSPPAEAPMPVTEATAAEGKQSETVVYRLADHPWWADVARLISAMAPTGFPTNTASTASGMQPAASSMAPFRARPAGQLRAIRKRDIQPP